MLSTSCMMPYSLLVAPGLLLHNHSSDHIGKVKGIGREFTVSFSVVSSKHLVSGALCSPARQQLLHRLCRVVGLPSVALLGQGPGSNLPESRAPGENQDTYSKSKSLIEAMPFCHS